VILLVNFQQFDDLGNDINVGLLFGLVMCCCRQNVLRLVEASYHDHCAYHTEADTLHAWIECTSETVKSLTAGIDLLSKEELELTIDKLDVTTV